LASLNRLFKSDSFTLASRFNLSADSGGKFSRSEDTSIEGVHDPEDGLSPPTPLWEFYLRAGEHGEDRLVGGVVEHLAEHVAAGGGHERFEVGTLD
jgi:hypothetical protein